MVNCNLYEEVENYIKNYMNDEEEFIWDDFLDGLQESVEKMYPKDKVEVFSYEVDNDTFELDMAIGDLLHYAKNEKIIDYSVNWDDNMCENLIITIVSKGD